MSISTTGGSGTNFEDINVTPLTDVFLVLENEGVEKFEASWSELLEETQAQLDSADK